MTTENSAGVVSAVASATGVESETVKVVLDHLGFASLLDAVAQSGGTDAVAQLAPDDLRVTARVGSTLISA